MCGWPKISIEGRVTNVRKKICDRNLGFAALAPVPANLDTVRGLACFLLVCYHVVGDRTRGLQLPTTSDWHYVMSSFDFIRMPIFTILSGFLYGHQRVTASNLAVFARKKIRRIVVPLLVATTIYWVLKEESGDHTKSLLVALFWPYEHLWYLQALVILFGSAAIVDAVFKVSPGALLVAVIVLALISADRPDVVTLFSIDGAMYLAPYFAFGIFLASAPRVLEDRNIGILLGVLAGAILVFQQASLNDLVPPISKYEFIATVCGIASCVFVLQFMRPISLLATVGQYSYTIYLWHVLFNASARKVMIALGFDAPPLLFAVGVAVGIGGSIALYHFASRTAWLSIPLLGITKPGKPILSDPQTRLI